MEAELISELQRITSRANSIEEVLDQTEQCLILLKENAALFHILVEYHIDRDLEDIVEQTARHYDEHRQNALNIVLDPDMVYLVSSYLYAGCYNLIREWLVRDIQKTPREIAQLLVDIVSKDYL